MGRGVKGRGVEGRRGRRVGGGRGGIVSIFGPKFVKNRQKIHSKSIEDCITTEKFKYRRLEIEKRVPRTVRHRPTQERHEHLEAKIGKTKGFNIDL